MKIAIPVTNSETMAGTFGRAERFAIYDSDTLKIEYITNSINLNAAHGAGIQAATTLVNNGVTVVLSPRIGPKAFNVLQSAQIKCYHVEDRDIKVEDVVKKYYAGSLKTMDAAQV